MLLSQWYMVLAFSLTNEIEESNHTKRHSRYKKTFYRALEIHEKRRRAKSIPRVSLVSVRDSPWRKVLKSRVDQSFITLLGFNVESFFYICKKIAPLFDNHSPFLDDRITLKRTNRGRKRLIRVEDCVALFLAWTRTRGSMFVL